MRVRHVVPLALVLIVTGIVVTSSVTAQPPLAATGEDNSKSLNPSGQSSEHGQVRRVGLFVGIDKYQDPKIRTLKTARNDAIKMHEVMRAQCGLDEGIILTNEQATQQAVREAICNTLVVATHPGDEVFIYWSGHGTRCPGGRAVRTAKKTGRSLTTADGFDDCLVPYDARSVDTGAVAKSVAPNDGSSAGDSSRRDPLEDLVSRAPRVFPIDSTSVIRDGDLKAWLQKLDGRKVLLIADVGFCPRVTHFRADEFGNAVMSFGAAEHEKGLPPSRPPLAAAIDRCFLAGDVVRLDTGEELLSADSSGPNGIAVLTAAKIGNPVFERREGDLSVMTHFLTRLLAEGKGPITLAAAYKHLKTEVAAYVQGKEKDVPDFQSQKPLLVDRNVAPVYLRRATTFVGPSANEVVTAISPPVSPADDRGETPIRPGDRVVATEEAPIQVGTTTLATIAPGKEMVVTAVNGDWVAATVRQDAKDISGWIHVKRVAHAPPPAATGGGATLPWDGGATLPWAGGGLMAIVPTGDSGFTVDLGGLMFSGITLSVGSATPQPNDEQPKPEGLSWLQRLGASDAARSLPKPGPIDEWQLQSASGPTTLIDREKLVLRLVIPVKGHPTSCQHLVDFIGESRLDVVLPDGTMKSLPGRVDIAKAKQYLYWNSVYEPLKIGAVDGKDTQKKNGVSAVFLNMRPADLLRLGPGKHVFTWVSGKKKSNELTVGIR